MKDQFNKTLFDKAKDWAIKFVFGEPDSGTRGGFSVSSDTQVNGMRGSLVNSYEAWVSEAYEQNETVCGAINLIANTFCEAELRVVDEEGNHLDNSVTQQLFDYIGKDITTRQFFQTIIMYMYLGGSAFVEKIRDGRGRITALAPLRPDRITLQVDAELGISHYEFRNGSFKVDIPKENIIWIPFLSARSPYESFSPLWSVLRTINSDNSAKTHSETLLQNGGRPGAVIQYENELDPEDAHMRAKSWDRAFKGKNGGTTAVLYGGAKYEVIGFSMKDLDFTSLRAVDEAKILSTLRIPLQVYGSITSDKASTFSNVKEAKKQFWEQCIIPLQTLILDALNDDEELQVDGEIIFDRSKIQALQTDINEAANRAKAAYSYPGYITLNEARAMIGLEPVENGDELNQPQSFGFGLDQTQSSDNNKNDDYHTLLKQALEGAKEHGKKTAQLDAATVKKKTEAELRRQLKIILGREAVAKKFLRKTKKLAADNLNRHMNDAIAIVGETKGTKAVKQFERNRILKALYELISPWEQQLQEDAEDVLVPLLKESALLAASDIGANITVSDTLATEYMREYTLKFARKLTTTSYNQLKTTLETAYSDGLNISQTSKAIQDLGDQWSKNRSTMIARTETSRAANEGARIGYKQAGVRKLVFSAILDGSTSEICQALDGKVVGIEDNFINEGDNSFGMNLDYTGGIVNTPPCHPNCRSAIIPVIE